MLLYPRVRFLLALAVSSKIPTNFLVGCLLSRRLCAEFAVASSDLLPASNIRYFNRSYVQSAVGIAGEIVFIGFR